MSNAKGKAIRASCTYKTKVIVVDAMKYETRCPHSRCNKILFKGVLGPGTKVEVLCQGCRGMTILEVT
jgi:hypothetical protein